MKETKKNEDKDERMKEIPKHLVDVVFNIMQ